MWTLWRDSTWKEREVRSAPRAVRGLLDRAEVPRRGLPEPAHAWSATRDTDGLGEARDRVAQARRGGKGVGGDVKPPSVGQLSSVSAVLNFCHDLFEKRDFVEVLFLFTARLRSDTHDEHYIKYDYW